MECCLCIETVGILRYKTSLHHIRWKNDYSTIWSIHLFNCSVGWIGLIWLVSIRLPPSPYLLFSSIYISTEAYANLERSEAERERKRARGMDWWITRAKLAVSLIYGQNLDQCFSRRNNRRRAKLRGFALITTIEEFNCVLISLLARMLSYSKDFLSR